MKTWKRNFQSVYSINFINLKFSSFINENKGVFVLTVCLLSFDSFCHSDIIAQNNLLFVIIVFCEYSFFYLSSYNLQSKIYNLHIHFKGVKAINNQPTNDVDSIIDIKSVTFSFQFYSFKITVLYIVVQHTRIVYSQKSQLYRNILTPPI